MAQQAVILYTPIVAHCHLPQSKSVPRHLPFFEGQVCGAECAAHPRCAEWTPQVLEPSAAGTRWIQQVGIILGRSVDTVGLQRPPQSQCVENQERLERDWFNVKTGPNWLLPIQKGSADGSPGTKTARSCGFRLATWGSAAPRPGSKVSTDLFR